MKLKKGDSLAKFYYTCFSFEKPEPLKSFINTNKWYFKTMTEEVKQQIRLFYKSLGGGLGG